MIGSKVITWDQRELERSSLKGAANSIMVHVGSEHRGRDEGHIGQEGDPSYLQLDVPRGMGRSVQQINLVDIELPNTSYNVSEHNNRIYFNEYSALTTLQMQEPFALNGYYPLYTTQAAAEAATGATGSHTHTDADHGVTGVTLYMSDGVTNYHGTYTGSDVTYATPTTSFACARFFAQVPPGTYTASQVASAVQRAMNNAWVRIDGTSDAAFAAPQNTYRVELDIPTGRLLVSAGTYTGDFNDAAFATTAGPVVSFAVRGLDQPDASPSIVGSKVNPLGIDVSAGTKEASGLQNPVGDSPMRVVLHMKKSDHALIPGDGVTLSDLVQSNSASGRVVYSARKEVHVLLDTGSSISSWDPAKLVRSGTLHTTGCMGPVLGFDPRRGQRQGLLSTLKTTIVDASSTTHTVYEEQVYANAAKSVERLVSHGLEGDIPALSPSATSTTLTVFEGHLLADGSNVGLNETDSRLEIASVEAVTEGDRVPALTLTSAKLVPHQSMIFETSIGSSTTHIHGSPNIRGISKVDLTRLGRCVFLSLETPAQGRLGTIFVPGSDEERPFFARLQLDADRDALEMNHDSAVGSHTFSSPVDITDVTLRVYDETGTRPLDTEGVFTSVLLEFVNLCNGSSS